MLKTVIKIAPRRGWRAFAGEVGVIVLGVLIAVGVGKLVEALDWRDKVATAKMTLNQDLRENAFFLASERAAVSSCLFRQLDRLEAAVIAGTPIERASIERARGRLFWGVYVHPTRPWDTLEWSSVVADNIPSHMSRKDRVFYREQYQAMGLMGMFDVAEAQETAELDLLANGSALDQRTRNELLKVISRERQRVDLMNSYATSTLREFAAQGLNFTLTPREIENMNTRKWCRTNGLL